MSNNSAIDYYGFNQEYDRKKDYPTKKFSPSDLGKPLLIIFGILCVVIILFMFGFSGYIAWNSFIDDPYWLKFSKTYLAIIFSPIFLFYIFLRSVIFKLPK